MYMCTCLPSDTQRVPACEGSTLAIQVRSYESRFRWLCKQLIRSTAAWRSARRWARCDVLCQRSVETGCSDCSNPAEPLFRHPKLRIRQRGTLDRGPFSQIWHRASFAPSQPQRHCILSILHLFTTVPDTKPTYLIIINSLSLTYPTWPPNQEDTTVGNTHLSWATAPPSTQTTNWTSTTTTRAKHMACQRLLEMIIR